ncbi:hypothetical protein [Desulfamplus magnetovallimortis]|nr:hypothetical protein [Desulfamplus magnetovallimortis]
MLLGTVGGCDTNREPASAVKSGDVVATINEYDITLPEFNALMKFESEVDPEFQITMGSRKKFLDYLIQKELYIQEASKLKLDQKDAFIRTIEKYWESTLIRHLLDLKNREFRENVLVTQDEIEAFYSENREHFNDEPLEAVEDRIRKSISGKRIAAMNQEWTDKLRDTAKIKINEAFIQENGSDMGSEEAAKAAE